MQSVVGAVVWRCWKRRLDNGSHRSDFLVEALYTGHHVLAEPVVFRRNIQGSEQSDRVLLEPWPAHALHARFNVASYRFYIFFGLI